MSRDGADPGAAEGELLELVVHDLRSPLTTIAGFAELLAGHPGAMDEAGRANALAAIRRAAAHAAGLLDGLAELLGAEGAPAPEGIVGAVPTLDVVAELSRTVEGGVFRRQVAVRGARGAAWVAGSPERLSGLLSAFVADVAWRRSPGGTVEITVDSGVEVVVRAEAGSRGGGLARYVLRHLVAALDGRLEVVGDPEQLACHLPAAGAPPVQARPVPGLPG